MKSYIKPVLEYISLTVEERFASGSGTVCTVWGTCDAWGIKQFTDKDGITHYVNHGD